MMKKGRKKIRNSGKNYEYEVKANQSWGNKSGKVGLGQGNARGFENIGSGQAKWKKINNHWRKTFKKCISEKKAKSCENAEKNRKICEFSGKSRKIRILHEKKIQ